MQGFEPRGSVAGDLTACLTYMKVGNTTVITAGNAVYMNAGFLENKTSTSLLIGVAAETVTGNTTSTECGVYCDPNILYYNDADGDLATIEQGLLFKTAFTAGKMKIDQSTAAANPGALRSTYGFVLIKRNPDGDADISKGLFKIHTAALQF